MIADRFAALLIIPAILVAGASVPTTVSLTRSRNPSVFGQPVTFTAVVTPSSATGKVTFYNGTSVLGIVLIANGQATLSTIMLPAGQLLVRAYYSGDAIDLASTSTVVAQTVEAMPANGFGMPSNYNAGSYPQAVAVGDFNGDGIADLAVATNTTINLAQSLAVVLLGNGDGTFKAPVNYSVPGPVVSVVVGDFNGDGKADLAFGPNNVLPGNGDGTFQPAKSGQAVAFGYGLAAGDFNGDGNIDLAFPAGEFLGVVLGNGDGTFQPETDYAIKAGPYFTYLGNAVVGDFNGDGKADVALAVTGNTSETASVNVFLGNGDGTFQSPESVSPGGLPLFLAVGDFNGDGKLDLASANMDGQATVLLGNGDGTLQPPLMVGSVGAHSVAVGDFNGDGKADLALPDKSGETVSVFLGNGDGTFQPAANYGAGNFPYAVTVGEFRGDGRTDLAILSSGTDSGSNNLNILLGSAASSPQVALTSSLNPSIYGQSVTLTATVTPALTDGTVIFEGGTTVLGTASVEAGSARLTTTALGAGSHALAVIYYSASENAVSPVLTQTVSRVTTTTALTSSANPSIYLQPLTLIAKVSPSTAAGTVSFISTDIGVLGNASPVVSGTAAFAVTPSLQQLLSSIVSPITAYYSGDFNHTASTSQELKQVFKPTPTTVTLTSSPDPSGFHQIVTLTATVSPPPSINGGSVTFRDGPLTLVGTWGGSWETGVITLTLSTLSAGTHSLTAAFAGSVDYQSSASPVVSQTVNPQSSSAPVILPNGVVNAANPSAGLASGTWLAIYGTNLSTTTRTWTQADFIGNNLPTSLDEVSVTINGKPAYVYYISPTQLNVLAPGDPTQGDVPVQVAHSDLFSTPMTVSKLGVGPAFFAYSQNSKYAVAEDGVTYALIGPAGLLGSAATTRPATVGEVITLYATGLGETNPQYPDGQIIQTALPLVPAPHITIGGVAATVMYAGLVEAGVYQINVMVPPLPSGDALLVLSTEGFSAPSQVFISIQ